MEDVSRLSPRAGNELFNLLTGEGVGVGTAEDEDLTINHYFAMFNVAIVLILDTRCIIRGLENAFVRIQEFIRYIFGLHLVIIRCIGIQVRDGKGKSHLLRHAARSFLAADDDADELSILVESNSAEWNGASEIKIDCERITETADDERPGKGGGSGGRTNGRGILFLILCHEDCQQVLVVQEAKLIGVVLLSVVPFHELIARVRRCFYGDLCAVFIERFCEVRSYHSHFEVAAFNEPAAHLLRSWFNIEIEHENRIAAEICFQRVHIMVCYLAVKHIK